MLVRASSLVLLTRVGLKILVQIELALHEHVQLINHLIFNVDLVFEFV